MILHSIYRFSKLAKQGGFTLTELILVIVFLGVLSAVVLPKWFNRESFVERGYFDEVLQATRYAQKMAVVSNCNVAFNLDGSGASIQIQSTSGHGHCVDAQVFLPGRSSDISSPSGVSSPSATVIFQPFGDTQSSVNTDIHIGNYRMRIYAETGFVERL